MPWFTPMLKFKCPKCQMRYEAVEPAAGTALTCEKCGHDFAVPSVVAVEDEVKCRRCVRTIPQSEAVYIEIDEGQWVGGGILSRILRSGSKVAVKTPMCVECFGKLQREHLLSNLYKAIAFVVGIGLLILFLTKH